MTKKINYTLFSLIVLFTSCDKEQSETCGDERIAQIKFTSYWQFKAYQPEVVSALSTLNTYYVHNPGDTVSRFLSTIEVSSICSDESITLTSSVDKFPSVPESDLRIWYTSSFGSGSWVHEQISFSGTTRAEKIVTISNVSFGYLHTDIYMPYQGSWPNDSMFFFSRLSSVTTSVKYHQNK